MMSSARTRLAILVLVLALPTLASAAAPAVLRQAAASLAGVDTHVHADNVSGGPSLARQLGVPA